MELKDNPNIVVSPVIKLKDKPDRASYIVDLHKFKFAPDMIVISKIRGENNRIQVFAVKNSPKKDGNKPDIQKK